MSVADHRQIEPLAFDSQPPFDARAATRSLARFNRSGGHVVIGGPWQDEVHVAQSLGAHADWLPLFARMQTPTDQNELPRRDIADRESSLGIGAGEIAVG